MDLTQVAVGAASQEPAVDADATAATDAALHCRGLVLLSHAPLVVCRAIDTCQTYPAVLDVSCCGLQECCMLEGEQELQQLVLSSNALPALLPHHVSGLARLTRLELSRNRLADLAGLAFLPGLAVLLLGRNRLQDSSLQHITGLSQLQLLDLHANSISSLQQLAALPSLQELNAAANRLQQLPCLTQLTGLTTLNLRKNQLGSLEPAATAAVQPGVPAPVAVAGGQQLVQTYIDSSSRTNNFLPSSLVRLSLAQNRLAQPALLLPLRQLPALAELCLDGNPWQQHGASRSQLLACCPPSLLLLDSQVVSPSERVLILTSAVKLSAPLRGGAAAAGAAISSGVAASTLLAAQLEERQQQQSLGNAWAGVQQQDGGTAAQHDAQMVMQQKPCMGQAGSTELHAAKMQVLGQHLPVKQRQPQQPQQQQQNEEEQQLQGQQQAGQQLQQQGYSSPAPDGTPATATATAAAAAAARELELGAASSALPAVPEASAAGDSAVIGWRQLHSQHISSAAETLAGAGAGTANHTSSSGLRQPAPVQQQQQAADSHPKLGIVAKLRPYSADDVAAHVSSSSSWPHSATCSGSLPRQPGRRPWPSSAGPADSQAGGPSSSSSSSLVRGIRAARGPDSLTGYAAFAAACSAGAAPPLAAEHGTASTATAAEDASDAGSDSFELAQEPTVLPLARDTGSSETVSDPGLCHGTSEQQQPLQMAAQQGPAAAGVHLAASLAAPSAEALAASLAAEATPEEAAATHVVGNEVAGRSTWEAAATAATLATPADKYQGPLAVAAVACGVMLPAGAGATAEGCTQHYCTTGVFLPAAGEEAIERAAAGGGGAAPISAAELEAHYFQARPAVVSTDRRRRVGPQSVTPPPAGPATPGMSLAGGRLLLAGAAALASLRGEALAHVSDVTLLGMPYSKVRAAMPLLAGLSRLSSLALSQLSGLASLPQLHPLLALASLRHLTVEGCPLAGLVLLRPYLGFRFPRLQSFNGVAISQAEVVAAAELFGPLDAALAAALAQAPQQAALAASGLLRASRGSKYTQPSKSNNSRTSGCSSQAAAGTVWCAGGSCGLESCAMPVTAASSGELCKDAGDAPAAAAVTPGGFHSSVKPAGTMQAADWPAAPGSCGVSVSSVFAAMGEGPLIPSGPALAQGTAFAAQLLGEAGAVQEGLAQLHQAAWPGLVQASIRQGWAAQ